MGTLPKTTIVVPCYNEEERLEDDDFFELLADESNFLLLVDDGSKDATLARLHQIAAARADRISVLPLHPNRGKAEAVRAGLVEAAKTSELIGFIDADMATPVDEVLRLIGIAHDSDAEAIIGSRVAQLGSNIDRDFKRHVLGRIFATAASLSLGEQVYDTQCGAKFFRVGPKLQATIAEQFKSRWAFDVELIGRLLKSDAKVIEVPLRTWVDVPGSKIGWRSMLKAGLDLIEISRDLRK